MASYIIRRILISIPLLFGISIVSFGIIQLAPGDPASLMLDPTIKPSDRQAYIEEYGFDDPIPVQYGRWISHMVRGDFGDSVINQGESVSSLIWARLPNTLLLMGASILFAIVISIPLGVWSATKPYTITDYSISTGSFLGLATPDFWLGLILIMVLAVHLNVFPAGGVATLNAPFSLWDRFLHLVLPAFVLGSASMAGLVRYTRSGMMDVLNQDYIRTARSKGLRSGKVIYKHGLRNGMIPVLTLVGLMLPEFVSGAVLTETVFAWPGLGQFFVQEAFQRDYPVIMAITMIIAALVVIGNLVADILYAVFDPRIEYK